ncbi:hypothetical protein KEM48_009725 [Puccinia striiformis f. sp. tritici PST-130]|nr:hypothetical protein KEM48_009725 [Puccinia striiformis f. sp. tritici PST-130]
MTHQNPRRRRTVMRVAEVGDVEAVVVGAVVEVAVIEEEGAEGVVVVGHVGSKREYFTCCYLIIVLASIHLTNRVLYGGISLRSFRKSC